MERTTGKQKAAYVVSLILCLLLSVLALGIGIRGGWADERARALGSASPAAVQAFNNDLTDNLTGRIAMHLGVTPIEEPLPAQPADADGQEAEMELDVPSPHRASNLIFFLTLAALFYLILRRRHR